MVRTKTLFDQISYNLDAVLELTEPIGTDLWDALLREHPADIASFLGNLPQNAYVTLFNRLPIELAGSVFERLPETIQPELLNTLDTERAASILEEMPPDKVTDLFDLLSDADLKKYLNLLQKKQRHAVSSLLHFGPTTAGGIMNSKVLSLPAHISIHHAVSLLQRLQPRREHLARLYVTDRTNVLIGYINLDELLFNKPDTPIERILHKNELVINVQEDQELVARHMQHYDLMVAPVVDEHHHFLGIITADNVFDIIQEEAGEDVYKLSGLTIVEYPYFQTSFWMLLWQRTPWLIGLLVLQSISSIIMGYYEGMLEANIILSLFITMLIGTGGNAGNQSSALVVRGLTTGEMNRQNTRHVLAREFRIALVIATLLTVVAFFRIYLDPQPKSYMAILAVCSSLYAIVVTSIMLGTFLPILFERLNIDPAHTAAPFLATLMDIIGILIYCSISYAMLG